MDETEVQLWNEFAGELRRRVRWDVERIDRALAGSLEAIPGLEPKERSSSSKSDGWWPKGPVRLAVAFLRIGPAVLRSLSPVIRRS